MDMVERVEAAITAADERWYRAKYAQDITPEEFDAHVAELRSEMGDNYAVLARAAIEAMREPDEAFMERLAERAHDGRFSKSGELYPVYRNFLRAFFATALGDQP